VIRRLYAWLAARVEAHIAITAAHAMGQAWRAAADHAGHMAAIGQCRHLMLSIA
jgi:hypothetical protein